MKEIILDYIKNNCKNFRYGTILLEIKDIQNLFEDSFYFTQEDIDIYCDGYWFTEDGTGEDKYFQNLLSDLNDGLLETALHIRPYVDEVLGSLPKCESVANYLIATSINHFIKSLFGAEECIENFFEAQLIEHAISNGYGVACCTKQNYTLHYPEQWDKLNECCEVLAHKSDIAVVKLNSAMSIQALNNFHISYYEYSS